MVDDRLVHAIVSHSAPEPERSGTLDVGEEVCMTWLSKPKRESPPPEPEACARCGARPGAGWLHFVAPPTPEGRPARPLWLCAPCQAAARRDASGN